MHVVAPKEASTCRSKDSEGEWIEGTYAYVIACNSFNGQNSQMRVVEDFKWNEQKLPKVLPGYSGGRLPSRSTKEAGRKEEEKEDSGARIIRNEIAQEVIEGIKWKASAHEDAGSTTQRNSRAKCQAKLGLLANRNEEEEQEEERQQEDQMQVQWAEDEMLEEIWNEEEEKEVP